MFNGSTYYTLLVSGKPRHWTGSESIGSAENDDSRHLNSKSEYRNPKQIQSPNVPMLETNTLIAVSILNVAQYSFGHLDFGHLILVSVFSFGEGDNFGFRDSDFCVQ